MRTWMLYIFNMLCKCACVHAKQRDGWHVVNCGQSGIDQPPVRGVPEPVKWLSATSYIRGRMRCFLFLWCSPLCIGIVWGFIMTTTTTCNRAIIRNLFRGKCFLSPISFLSFLFSSFFCPFLLPRSGLSHPAKRGRSTTLAPAAKAFLVFFRTQETCLVAVNVVLFLLNEIQNWNKCGCFWMLPCSRLLNSTWLFLDILLTPKTLR